MNERQPNTESRLLRSLTSLAGAALILSGCSQPPAEVTVRADISPVLQDKTHCNGGAVRPCVALIRTKPQQSAPLLNADRNQITPVKWPVEKYGTTVGYPVTVVCQVLGQTIYDSTNQKVGNHVSSVWDVVKVSSDHLAVSRQNPQHTPATSFGYAADLLLGNHGIYDELPSCGADENPAGAKPVK